MSGNRRQCSRRGFTLVEVLVALAVVSTAATILVSLFGSSLMLSRTNRSQMVAASLAEEQMENILRNSPDYVWTNLDGAEPGQLVEIVPVEQAAAETAASPKRGVAEQRLFSAPTAEPVEPAANSREENFYAKFRWQAYAALPQPNSKHVDITVVVRWNDAGRVKSVALTSSAPRFSLGSRSPAAERPITTVQPVNAGGNA